MISRVRPLATLNCRPSRSNADERTTEAHNCYRLLSCSGTKQEEAGTQCIASRWDDCNNVSVAPTHFRPMWRDYRVCSQSTQGVRALQPSRWSVGIATERKATHIRACKVPRTIATYADKLLALEDRNLGGVICFHSHLTNATRYPSTLLFQDQPLPTY